MAQRALEEWERTLCENKAVAILAQMQAGRPALIPERRRRNAHCQGFAADRGSLEMDSRVLGDLVLPLIV